MIVLITGGRDYKNQREMRVVLDQLHAKHKFTYLMHGDAAGADQMAHRWAKKNGVQPVAFEALWDPTALKTDAHATRVCWNFVSLLCALLFQVGAAPQI